MKGGTYPTERIYCLIATVFRAYDINYLICLFTLPSWTCKAVHLVHIYKAHNRATMRQSCLYRLGLMRSTCDHPFPLRLPYLNSEFIITYTFVFVNYFFKLFLVIYFPLWGCQYLTKSNKIRYQQTQLKIQWRKLYEGLTTPLVLYDNIIITYINNSVNTFFKLFLTF